MGNEIELISDGDGLAVIGNPSAVERFMASVGLSSDSGAASGAVLDFGATLAQAGAEIAENSGRWVKLTEDSARKVKKFGLMDTKTPGVKHAMIGQPGDIQQWIQIVKTPTAMVSNPAVLAGGAGIMAQMAMKQTMAEITDYLATIAAGYDAVRREIGALRKVQHPNVVQVIWADRTDHGEWYLIMEYIDGEILAEYATGKKQLRDREAIDVALDVLGALIAIHPDSERLDALEAKKLEGEISAEEYDELMSMSDNALVHRDIKPQNIMLTRSGAKLLDFNISSRVGDPVHTVSGTPPYQPPDADLTRWDVSTDLFAVGVTLYELLCDGQHPYPQARPMPDVEPRDPRQFRNDLNEDLSAFLLRACANDRGERFQTAAEMRSALDQVRASL